MGEASKPTIFDFESIDWVDEQKEAHMGPKLVEAAARTGARRKRLATGEAPVHDIAAPFSMSQPAVSKHLKVLERAGLVERNIDKQRRPARLKAAPMEAAVHWLEDFKQFWAASFDQLDGLLEDLKNTETQEKDQ